MVSSLFKREKRTLTQARCERNDTKCTFGANRKYMIHLDEDGMNNDGDGATSGSVEIKLRREGGERASGRNGPSNTIFDPKSLCEAKFNSLQRE